MDLQKMYDADESFFATSEGDDDKDLDLKSSLKA